MAVGSWVGTEVRHKEKGYGKVAWDRNFGRVRCLGIALDNGSKAEITMNNVGPDPKCTAEWEYRVPEHLRANFGDNWWGF